MVRMLFKRLATMTAISMALTLGVAAQTTPPKPAPAFQPGLGDLMTAFVQPRHIKLGLAGQARNWDYLTYERNELEEAFDLVEEQVPRFANVAMSDLLQIIKAPMSEIDAAIKARDGARFDAAYAQLTNACNACHVSTQHAMIVIQVPKASMFPDQNFAPQKP